MFLQLPRSYLNWRNIDITSIYTENIANKETVTKMNENKWTISIKQHLYICIWSHAIHTREHTTVILSINYFFKFIIHVYRSILIIITPSFESILKNGKQIEWKSMFIDIFRKLLRIQRFKLKAQYKHVISRYVGVGFEPIARQLPSVFWTERSNLVQSLCITRNRFSVIGGWKMRHGCNDESQRGIFYAVRWKRWCVLNVWRTSRGGCEKCFFHNLWLTGPFFFSRHVSLDTSGAQLWYGYVTAEDVLIVKIRTWNFQPRHEVSSVQRPKRALLSVSAEKQAIYDGDKFRNIPRRSYRDRLITTLGLTNRTTLPEKRKARADVPSKWGIVWNELEAATRIIPLCWVTILILLR